MNKNLPFSVALGLALLFASAAGRAAPVEKTVDYKIDGQSHRGYVYYDDAEKDLPLLILVSLQDSSLVSTLTSGELVEEVVRTLVGSIGLVLAIPVLSLRLGFSDEVFRQWTYRRRR